jgi:hypothetical protein
MRENDKIDALLLDDLDAIQDYVANNKVESYFLLINTKPGEYFIAQQYRQLPNTLLSTLELTTLELKLRFALLPLLEAVEQASGCTLPDITEMLRSIDGSNNKLND